MNRLKELRTEFGYTVRDVQNLTNFDYSTVSCYENEIRNMNASIMIIFANLYQVTIDYLLNYSELGIYIFDENNDKLLLNKNEFTKHLSNKEVFYKDGKRYLSN